MKLYKRALLRDTALHIFGAANRAVETPALRRAPVPAPLSIACMAPPVAKHCTGTGKA